jgi:glutathione S-transferase
VTLKLVIGNKNYSSWSMRPWMAMKIARIAFEERVISLDDPAFKSELRKLTPAGKVPVLIDGDRHVWESLAIIEYLAEKFPDAKVWPRGAGARAHARVICAEMHAGFAPLRHHCAMNMMRPPGKRELPPEVQRDVTRCLRPSCRAFIPMISTSARTRVLIWRRLWRCRRGRSGKTRRGRRPGCCRAERSTGRKY